MRRRRRPSAFCDCPQSSPPRPDLTRMTVAIPCQACSGAVFTLGPGELGEVIQKLTELRDAMAAGIDRARLPKVTPAEDGRVMSRWPDRAVSWTENG
jgi:hypothetical protein